MHPLESYLNDLREIRSTGGAVPEKSYYGVLENLLNEVGKKLKPKPIVRCVPQVKDTGAGSPDFGLYTASQFQRSKDREPIPDLLPERGVIEVKPLKDDTWLTAQGEQATRYWGHYNQVLVTNYRHSPSSATMKPANGRGQPSLDFVGWAPPSSQHRSPRLGLLSSSLYDGGRGLWPVPHQPAATAVSLARPPDAQAEMHAAL